MGSVNFASGKFVMIIDGLGFSLIPWHPVLERLERQLRESQCPAAISTEPFGRARGFGF
jgi:hypothetical protein